MVAKMAPGGWRMEQGCLGDFPGLAEMVQRDL